MADFGSLSANDINSSMGLGFGGVGAQGQNQLNNIFGNFGQQTDYYSGLGAAYGRATGGFNGGALPDAGPLNPVYGGGGGSRDALAGLMSPTPMAQQGGMYASQPWWGAFVQNVGPQAAQDWAAQQGGGGGGGGGGATFDQRFGNIPPPTSDPYNPPVKPPQQPLTQDWTKYFNDLTAPQQQPQPSGGGYGDMFAGMSQGDLATWTRAMQAAGRGSEVPSSLTGGGSPPANGPYANLGYNPGFGSNFAFGGGQNFQNMYGMGFPNAGTPSQYTASPYTNTQGQTFQPNLPQGSQTQFGPDDPNGALNAAEQQRIFAQTPRS
jgi:hypothetical protein